MVSRAEYDAALSAARAEGAAGELARVRAILTLAEAKAAPHVAIALALQPSVSVETARKAMADTDFAKGASIARSLKR